MTVSFDMPHLRFLYPPPKLISLFISAVLPACSSLFAQPKPKNTTKHIRGITIFFILFLLIIFSGSKHNEQHKQAYKNGCCMSAILSNPNHNSRGLPPFKGGKHSAQYVKGIGSDASCLKRLFLDSECAVGIPTAHHTLTVRFQKQNQIIYKPRLRLRQTKITPILQLFPLYQILLFFGY